MSVKHVPIISFFRATQGCYTLGSHMLIFLLYAYPAQKKHMWGVQNMSGKQKSFPKWMKLFLVAFLSKKSHQRCKCYLVNLIVDFEGYCFVSISVWGAANHGCDTLDRTFPFSNLLIYRSIHVQCPNYRFCWYQKWKHAKTFEHEKGWHHETMYNRLTNYSSTFVSDQYLPESMICKS